MRRIMVLYMRGRKTAPFMARMRFDRSVFRFGKPRALARGASLILAIILIPIVLTFAEEITITTYYPSPNGAYDAMNVKRLSVGDTNGDGNVNAFDVPSSRGYLLVADRLGIGTANPAKTLHVNDGVLVGDGYPTPSGTVFTNVSQAQLILAGTLNAGYNVGDNVAKLLITGVDNDASTAIYPIYVQDENGLVDFWLKNRQGASSLPTAYFGGNLGIGTTAPGNKLHLKNGNLEIETGDLRFYPDTSGYGAEFDYYNGKLYIGRNTEYSSQWNVVIQDNGNVGIGTVNPSQKLDVAGYVNGQSGLCMNGDCRTSWAPAKPNCRTVYAEGQLGARASCNSDEWLMTGGVKCDHIERCYIHRNVPNFEENYWDGDCFCCNGTDTIAHVRAVCCKK